ncbi:MAG: phenylalanine--tRNA ligase subunit alpha [Candidatus Omnitrophica bacterium]|nr:phenylalanine--tRNA ligase subunit alpha [Candidatus Omnitrophota bacterium]MBU4477560.1 phenylalanine--tRNA ligase subunit alpha [Candidatus Omnitrophota bacterium]MCG2703588.1 phenylalanine--tRNA ligase subunit alpha [Candidatus Omnitrophota bacterium]
MQDKLVQIEKEFEQDAAQIASVENLEAVRIKYLGRKDGEITRVFKLLPQLAVPEKARFGQKINELKEKISQRIEQKAKELETQRKQALLSGAAAGPDTSLPSIKGRIGAEHPLAIVIEEICGLFVEMGFRVMEGPEIETEYYNFEALNIPLEHPSREAFDTFYLENRCLLRSHTSPVQVRFMENNKPPVQIVVPGRVYRPDATDASHSYMFHQIEGLLIDKGITFAHLKGVLGVFAKKLFGEKTQMRFRPHFFPFTEPSAEVDVTCIICSGKGCSVCKQSGWLEILGSGMVHPNVLKAGGIDSKIYSGFAFGMGIERIAMLKYGIDDIRLFFDNDIRFIRQFS